MRAVVRLLMPRSSGRLSLHPAGCRYGALPTVAHATHIEDGAPVAGVSLNGGSYSALEPTPTSKEDLT